MGCLLSKMKKCNRGNQQDALLCNKKKTFAKGRMFFNKGKKLPRSQVAFEELKHEAQHPILSFKCKRNGKEIWPKKRKTSTSYEEALRQQENQFMLQYLELQDRKQDRVSKWLDIMDTDKQSYSGLYIESDCSCNTSMYSIESRCDSMVSLGSKLNPRIESSIESDPDCSYNKSMYSVESRSDSKLNLGSRLNPRIESSLESDPDCSYNKSMYSVESRSDSKLNLGSRLNPRIESSLESDPDCSYNKSMYSVESRSDSKLNLGSKVNPRIASSIDSDSNCSCNTSMYSIESKCNSKLNLASNDPNPRLDSSLDSDSDYMSDTLDYEADISSNDLDVDNLQSNETTFNVMAEIEDCFKPGGEYFGLYCDLFTKEVTRLYNEYYGGESESRLESQIQNLCAEKSVKMNLQESEAVFHNEKGVEQLE